MDESGNKLNAAAAALTKSIRIERGLTQEGLAALCQLDRTYVSGIERGKTNISLRVLEKIALALQLPISELLEKMKSIIDE